MKKTKPDNQIAFYQTPDGSVNIEVLYAEENISHLLRKRSRKTLNKLGIEI